MDPPLGVAQAKTMRPIRVIFLDFDGVLNSRQHYEARPPRTVGMTHDQHKDRNIDKAAIARLNVIVERTKAVVVVSSMWRYGVSRADLRGLLARNGFNGTTLDKTTERGDNRGLQIKQWLDETSRIIESFAILDDEDDFEHFGRNRLVKTSFMDGGLLDEHIEPTCTMLEKPWLRKTIRN
jgi:hypothetical protein